MPRKDPNLKFILLQVDKITHAKLNKLARAQAARLKPYLELFLTKHAQEADKKE